MVAVVVVVVVVVVVCGSVTGNVHWSAGASGRQMPKGRKTEKGSAPERRSEAAAK